MDSFGRRLSPFCSGRRHVACPHQRASGGRAGPGITLVLCGCECHTGCPLGERAFVPQEEWMAQCVCPGAEIEKKRVRHRPKPGRLEIPLHRNATRAQLTSDVHGLGFVLRFTGPKGMSWEQQTLSYEQHLGADMTLRDTAEWVERMMKVAGYRARRVKSGDKAVAAWVIWVAPRAG